MATIVFTPNYAIPIRVRAQPVYPVGTKLCLSNCLSLTRGAIQIQRGSTLKSEAQKGQRNSNSDSNVKEDEEKEAVKSIVERITASVIRTTNKPPVKKRFAPRFDPKEKVSELFGDTDNEEDFSNFFVKSTNNDDEKNDVFSSKSVSKGDDRSSKPLSNFDNLIKDDDKIDSTASKQDFKPSRPPSKFVRRSPIPEYISTLERSKTIPSEEKEEQEKDLHMVFGEESSENIPSEESLRMELRNKLEKLTGRQLMKIAKERGLKRYSMLTKPELVKLLMDSQV